MRRSFIGAHPSGQNRRPAPRIRYSATAEPAQGVAGKGPVSYSGGNRQVGTTGVLIRLRPKGSVKSCRSTRRRGGRTRRHVQEAGARLRIGFRLRPCSKLRCQFSVMHEPLYIGLGATGPSHYPTLKCMNTRARRAPLSRTGAAITPAMSGACMPIRAGLVPMEHPRALVLIGRSQTGQ